MKRIQKLLCAMFGHKFHTMTQVTTHQSQYGHVQCQRCGHVENYQYDF